MFEYDEIIQPFPQHHVNQAIINPSLFVYQYIP